MISKSPDKKLTPQRLEDEIKGFLGELGKKEKWFIYRDYIDNSIHREPYYIIRIQEEDEEEEDETYSRKVYLAGKLGNSTLGPQTLGIVTGTCQDENTQRSRWTQKSTAEVQNDLLNFLNMYRENYLEPPGKIQGHFGKKYDHKRFAQKKFIYEIQTPSKTIVGIGPQMYAGGNLGAIHGQALDKSGQPLANTKVTLKNKEETLVTTTDNAGLYWFSKVAAGTYEIIVDAPAYQLGKPRYEYFGNMKGWLTDEKGNPKQNQVVQLTAPDSETFQAHTDASGKFVSGPVPSFDYSFEALNHLFTIHHQIDISDAVFGGVVKNIAGEPEPNQKVVLEFEGAKLQEGRTDENGQFIFHSLTAGRYKISMPGIKTAMQSSAPKMISGVVANAKEYKTVQLVINDTPVYKERTSEGNKYIFQGVSPWDYGDPKIGSWNDKKK